MPKTSKSPRKPFILLILDGWGIAKKSKANAIELARKPVFDSLVTKYPNTSLEASGKYVGLPLKQPGNSEAGHMNIGAGRIVEQDNVFIDKEIATGKFFKNPAFVAALKHVRKHNSTLHLMGLLSDGGSPHGDPDHLDALLTFTRVNKIANVRLHLFTDGRDSLPHDSLKLVSALMRKLKNHDDKKAKTLSGEWIATIMGRFYAMDRKKEWSRTEQAYDAMVYGRGERIRSPQAAITQAYNRGETDEFIRPYVMERHGKPVGKISSDDAIIFFNLRSDRARQLAKPFVQKRFQAMNPGSFKPKRRPKNLLFVALTDFGPDLDSILTAFPSIDLKGTLPMALKKYRQLYIAEKEKYAHITYFINGGYADPVAGEDRVMVPSPDVVSYAQAPAMATEQIVDKVIAEMPQYDFIAINFAIPDMVAHTGDIKAGIAAVEAVDKQLQRLIVALKRYKGSMVITSDHGNADQMLDLKTGEMYTEHTRNLVPFILFSEEYRSKKLKKGKLGDVAPTILELLAVPAPEEMTGTSLLK